MGKLRNALHLSNTKRTTRRLDKLVEQLIATIVLAPILGFFAFRSVVEKRRSIEPIHLREVVIWAGVALTFAILIWNFFRVRKLAILESQQVAHRNGMCPNCLYPRTPEAESTTCPECGLEDARIETRP
jgi:hypothetical protein